jgi:hypothetical protein
MDTLSERSFQILKSVVVVMDTAEELGGPDTASDYILLMAAIADDANRRIRGILSHRSGEVNLNLLRSTDGFAPELRVRFVSRNPDPGVCRVRTIDWERGHASVSNGSTSIGADLSDLRMA